MKKIIMVLFVMIFLSACVMPVAYSVTPQQISIVSDVPSMTKDTIYQKLKKWLAITFVSSKAVMDYESIEEGVLTANIIVPSTSEFGYPSKLHLKIMFSCKDNKYKLDVLSVGVSEENCVPGEYRDCSTHYMFSSYVDNVNNKYEQIMDDLNKSILLFIKQDSNTNTSW